MESSFNDRMNSLGYTQLVCDIFSEWEEVKDELLPADRKEGSGNGTVHVFLGHADEALRTEFASYYDDVENGADPANNAVEITHYFSINNIVSMIGFVCRYYANKGEDFGPKIKEMFDLLSSFTQSDIVSTTSLFKLSVGSNRLRPYFKQFDSKGVFPKIIRNLLINESAYKISLYKNEEGEYGAYWLIGSAGMTDFEASPSKRFIIPNKQLSNSLHSSLIKYLSAIRTKPFLLLAGISGTGKSRIVKELAYSSCPDVGELRSDPTSPGNYCLVEVKPNWNDSTELLGYETVLDGGGYHLTKFVKFLIKAKQYEDVPFFVCLDEMNLAPVEQYFAEFLSVLESRKDVLVNGQRTIQSEPLIDGAIFKKYGRTLYNELFSKQIDDSTPVSGYSTDDEEKQPYYNEFYAMLMKEGLRIPHNLIVVGTVNMDDTTYQFSRKVIDRAMTIEMNEVDLDNILDNDKADVLSYPEEVLGKENFFAPFAQSREALPEIGDAERTQLVGKIKETIGQTDKEGSITENSLESILGKTPFRIAYRVVNELILHFYALRWQDNETPFEELYYTALDNILMMKVLPRIEGNEDLVRKPLTALQEWTNGSCPKSNQKIGEMITRLDSHFTSFWP